MQRMGRPVGSRARRAPPLAPRKGRKCPRGYRTFGSGEARLDPGLTLEISVLFRALGGVRQSPGASGPSERRHCSILRATFHVPSPEQ